MEGLEGSKLQGLVSGQSPETVPNAWGNTNGTLQAASGSAALDTEAESSLVTSTNHRRNFKRRLQKRQATVSVIETLIIVDIPLPDATDAAQSTHVLAVVAVSKESPTSVSQNGNLSIIPTGTPGIGATLTTPAWAKAGSWATAVVLAGDVYGSVGSTKPSAAASGVFVDSDDSNNKEADYSGDTGGDEAVANENYPNVADATQKKAV